MREGDDEQAQVCLTVVGVEQFEFFLQGTFSVTSDSAQGSTNSSQFTDLAIQSQNNNYCTNC